MNSGYLKKPVNAANKRFFLSGVIDIKLTIWPKTLSLPAHFTALFQ